MTAFIKLIYTSLLLIQVFGQEETYFEESFDLNSRATGQLPLCKVDGELNGELSKPCHFREGFYPEIIYRWQTAFGCWFYTQPNLKKPNVTLHFSSCFHPNFKVFKVPCFNVPGEEGCYPLDRNLHQTKTEISRLLLSREVVARWERCSKNAEECCTNDNAEHTLNETCPRTWDAWKCWDKGVEGETSAQDCPEFAYTNSGPACIHTSYKDCFDNGTWNLRTDYNTCSIKPRMVNRISFHSGWLGVSSFFCLPAIIVLSSYRRLRERRFALHRNLLISLFLRNIFVIIIKSAVMVEELTSANGDTVMFRNGFGCRLLSSLEKLAASSSFTCMLVDGMFLHRRIVAVFKRDLNVKWVYSLAIGATVTPVIIWICLMATMNDANCWLVYEISNIQWVLDAPRLLMLLVNTLLLIDILRLLITKLRRQENDNQLSTAKATLFLMPLFGVQFLLTAWRPNTTVCDLEQAYYFFTYAVDGLQGIMVSLLYCYFNKEVRGLITITYRKTENVVSTRFRSEANRRRPTQPDLDRRQTFSTMIADKSQEVEIQNERDTINKAIAYSDAEFEATSNPEYDVNYSQSYVPSCKLKGNDCSFNDLEFLTNDNNLDDEGFISIGFEHDVEENCGTVNTSSDAASAPITDRINNRNSVDRPLKYKTLDILENKLDEVDKYEEIAFNIPISRKKSNVFEGDSHVYENITFQESNECINNDFPTKRFSMHSHDSDERANDSNSEIKNERNNDIENDPQCDLAAVTFKDIDGECKKSVEKNSSISLYDNNHSMESGVTQDSNDTYGEEKTDIVFLPDDIVDNIDALHIFNASVDDIFKNNDVKKSENIVNETIENLKGNEVAYEDVVMDPDKLCPNRQEKSKVIFID